MHPKSAMRDKEGQRDHCDHVQPTWAFGEHWSTKWAQKVVQSTMSTSNMCGVELSWKSTTWIHIVCQRVWYNSMFPARKHRMEKRRLLWWLLGTVLYKLSLTLECRLNSLVRCANASLGGQTIHSWGLPFSEARILTREHVYQKRWTHFRECLSKKPMVFPNCQTVYCVQIQVLDKCLN